MLTPAVPVPTLPRFGPFELLGELPGTAAGGSEDPMQTGYRGRDSRNGRAVTIRLVPPNVVGQPERLAEFLRLANLGGRLRQPELPGLLQTGRYGGAFWLAFETPTGQPADALVRGSGAVAGALAAEIVARAARALDAAHRFGFMHGRLEPHQLWADIGDRPTRIAVSELGLSAAVSNAVMMGLLSAPHAAAEVEVFHAPETRGGLPGTPAADTYSMGVLLAYLLLGRTPTDAELTPQRLVALGVSEALAAVIGRAVVPNPAERWNTSLELALAAEAALPSSRLRESAALSSEAAAPPSEPEAPPLESAEPASGESEAPILPALPGSEPAVPSELVSVAAPRVDAAPRSSMSMSTRAIRRPPAAAGRSTATYIMAAALGACLLVIVAMAAHSSGTLDRWLQPPAAPTPPTKVAVVPKDDSGGDEDNQYMSVIIPEMPEPKDAKTPDTKPQPVTPPAGSELGTRYRAMQARLDKSAKSPDSEEHLTALREYRDFIAEFKDKPDAKAFVEQVSREFQKQLGTYRLARAEMKLPQPNVEWPGLEEVPNEAGFYKLFDGRRLNCHYSGDDEEWSVQSPRDLYGDPSNGGWAALLPRGAPFRDFEVRFQIWCLDDEAMFGPAYRFSGEEDGQMTSMSVGLGTAILSRGRSTRDAKEITSQKFTITSRDDFQDVRIIVHEDRHTLFVNGEPLIQETLKDRAVGTMALFLIRGKVRLRDVHLAIFDAEPGAKTGKPPVKIKPRVLSSGTGFLVTTDGYIVTNRHVIDGPGRIFVRIPDLPEPLPAELVAEHPKRDLAILRIKTDAPEVSRLKPLPLNPKPVVESQEVAAYGFPGGLALGELLKFTSGRVSTLPSEDVEGMMLLDVRVNPGNSGGPLCDKHGSVVGVITIKTRPFGGDSFGGAIPAADALAFLKDKVAKVQLPAVPDKPLPDWVDVTARVKPAVLMIVKME